MDFRNLDQRLGFDHGPQAVLDLGRQHAVQILDSHATQRLVVGVERAKLRS